MKQINIFDIIEEETNEQFCEVCKEPSTTSVHPKCIDIWYKLLFKREELPEELKDFYLK